jgi:predicted small lipoprotein YifL
LKKNWVENSFLIMLLISLSGCGFKGNPAPYPAMPDDKPLVKNMQALPGGDAVLIKWIFQDKKGLINHIIIESSQAGQPGQECKNCPRIYAKIGQIQTKEGTAANRDQRELSFSDTSAVKGKIYIYRLMLCEENGNCSESSAAEINFQ